MDKDSFKHQTSRQYAIFTTRKEEDEPPFPEEEESIEYLPQYRSFDDADNMCQYATQVMEEFGINVYGTNYINEPVTN